MAGRRRHYVTLEMRTETLDSFGEAALSYTTLASAWAEIKVVGGRERFESAQVKAEVSHRIKLRYDDLYSDIGEADRITLGTRIFDIVAVFDREGRERELEILAMERK